jgi:hypothetical protein
MTLRPLLGHALALFAAVAGLQALPAAAGTYSAGTLGGTPYINNVSVPVGSFLDTYTFDLTHPGQDLVGTVNSLELDWHGLSLLHISDLSATLQVVGSPGVIGSWTGNPMNVLAAVPAGSYQLALSGVADGSAGGNYTLSLAAPVPEPESYAMMLAGLGLLGLAARRRRR